MGQAWANQSIERRVEVLSTLLDHILLLALPGTRSVLSRFRWQDGYDDWLLFWYWGERNAEPWASWEDEALQRMWPGETSARRILAALKPGRKWRTVRPHAAHLGLRATVKRPDVAEILAEQDKEVVPTDVYATLVYYYLGHVLRGQVPDESQLLEVHEEQGKLWIAKCAVNRYKSVYTHIIPGVPPAAPTVTSTLTPAP